MDKPHTFSVAMAGVEVKAEKKARTWKRMN